MKDKRDDIQLGIRSTSDDGGGGDGGSGCSRRSGRNRQHNSAERERVGVRGCSFCT